MNRLLSILLAPLALAIFAPPTWGADYNVLIDGKPATITGDHNYNGGTLGLPTNAGEPSGTQDQGDAVYDTTTNSLYVSQGGGDWVRIGPTGRRNYILDGAFLYWPMGTTFTNSGAYGAGLYRHYDSGTHTITRVETSSTSAPGLRYWWRNTRTAGDTTTTTRWLWHGLTTEESRKLAGRRVTASLYYFTGAGYSGGDLSLIIYYGTGTDETPGATWTGGANATSVSCAPSSSVARCAATVTIPSSATQVMVKLGWAQTGTAPASDYVQTTGWQLEEGAYATPFFHRSREQVVADAEVFVWKTYDLDTAPGTATGVGAVESYFDYLTSGAITVTVDYPTRMRTTPTVTLYDLAGTSGVISYAGPAANGQAGTAGDIGTGRCEVTTDAVTNKRGVEFHAVFDARL